MALFTEDLPALFADIGVPVVFMAVTVQGHSRRPTARDALPGPNRGANPGNPSVLIVRGSLPLLAQGSAVTVSGTSYKVRELDHEETARGDLTRIWLELP